MKSAKIFIIFTFLLAFAVCVSGQTQTPEIVWKNLQVKNENFENIKPIIVNISGGPIYFECDMELSLSYGNISLFMFDKEYNGWIQNRMFCGFQTPKMLKSRKKEEKKIEKLKQAGKYSPSGCKLNPNEEFAILFNDSQWRDLKFGPVGPAYKSGKFKFQIIYWWYSSQNDNGTATAESSEFLVIPKEETK